MVEWSITAVLKTAVLRGTGGSNPSLSAHNNKKPAEFSAGSLLLYELVLLSGLLFSVVILNFHFLTYIEVIMKNFLLRLISVEQWKPPTTVWIGKGQITINRHRLKKDNKEQH